MSDVLLKGEDIKLLVNGEEFGGLTKVKSVRKNDVTEIGTFLSDVPVYISRKSSYEVDLELDIGEDCPFLENENIFKIEICCGAKSVRYDDCVVKNMKTHIMPKGRIKAEVTLTAKERTAQ